MALETASCPSGQGLSLDRGRVSCVGLIAGSFWVERLGAAWGRTILVANELGRQGNAGQPDGGHISKCVADRLPGPPSVG